MGELSSMELIESYAKDRGIKYYTSNSSKDNILIATERYSSTKYIVFFLDNISPDLYLIFFDSFSSKMGSKSIYCGLFKEYKHYNADVKIIKRDWFDMFSSKKRFLTGDSYVDKKVTIFHKNARLNHSLASPNNIKDFLLLSKEVFPIMIEVEKDSRSIVKELNRKNLISITTNKWLFDFTEIDALINKGSKLIEKMSQYS